MVYTLPTKSKIEFIALKIGNINQMVDFYTKVIGLSLIKRTENEAYLGIPSRKKLFISLRKIDDFSKDKDAANLKSFSLILPNQKSLKKILVHINNLGIKIPSVQINKYFDFFHLNDPEGNRIVLGVAKFNRNAANTKKIKWLKYPLNTIHLDDYLKGFNEKSEKVPVTTHFGWIEMTTFNLKRSINFYQKQLGLNFQLDSKDNRAVLVSSFNHCQQFVLDQDASIKAHHYNDLGLDYLDIKMFSPDDIDKLAKHLKTNGVAFQYSRPNNFLFVSDPEQINIMFSLV